MADTRAASTVLNAFLKTTGLVSPARNVGFISSEPSPVAHIRSNPCWRAARAVLIGFLAGNTEISWVSVQLYMSSHLPSIAAGELHAVALASLFGILDFFGRRR